MLDLAPTMIIMGGVRHARGRRGRHEGSRVSQKQEFAAKLGTLRVGRWGGRMLRRTVTDDSRPTVSPLVFQHESSYASTWSSVPGKKVIAAPNITTCRYIFEGGHEYKVQGFTWWHIGFLTELLRFHHTANKSHYISI